MAEDIFRFWKGVTSHVHPADKNVFRRVGKNGHRLNLKLLPGCYNGPLRNAPVVLLYLSPGESEEDARDVRISAARHAHEKRLTGYKPLPTKEEHGSAFRWWTERTKCFDIDPKILRSKVAVLNIGAYHSKNFSDQPLLAALPSSRVSIGWAQHVLFPQAERGERVVICLRAAKFWGLECGKTYGRSLYAPHVNRRGHMLDDAMREKIIKKVRQVIYG